MRPPHPSLIRLRSEEKRPERKTKGTLEPGPLLRAIALGPSPPFPVVPRIMNTDLLLMSRLDRLSNVLRVIFSEARQHRATLNNSNSLL
jgi:hypothetical protein